MKASEFRKLIREEIKAVLPEAFFNTDPDFMEIEKALNSDPSTKNLYKRFWEKNEDEIRELIFNAYRLGLKKKI
jgi:hypothetical protein